MQARSSARVKTFSIGFDEAGYDEAKDAKEVARHLGTDHTELYVTPREALAVIPRLPAIYDEPFADASQIPTVLVSQLARRSVTVSLSGDGGDELFGGYTRYRVGAALWGRVGWLPRPAGRALAALLRLPKPAHWDLLAPALEPFLRAYGTQGTFADKFRKAAEVLEMEDAGQLYERLVSAWPEPAAALAGGRAAPPGWARDSSWIPGIAERMMYADLAGYLPDDILVKVDRASMAVSLEARAPLLDHRLVEFAWRLPRELKLREGQGKRLLRRVLHKHVPRELVERPKMGFGVPVGAWLKGPLRDWAEALLDPKALRDQGYFEPSEVRGRWEEHLSGRRDWQYPLWCVLMFQAWREAQMP